MKIIIDKFSSANSWSSTTYLNISNLETDIRNRCLSFVTEEYLDGELVKHQKVEVWMTDQDRATFVEDL